MDHSPFSWGLAALSPSSPGPRPPPPPSPCLHAALGGQPAPPWLCPSFSLCSHPRSPPPHRALLRTPPGLAAPSRAPGRAACPGDAPCGRCRADGHRSQELVPTQPDPGASPLPSSNLLPPTVPACWPPSSPCRQLLGLLAPAVDGGPCLSYWCLPGPRLALTTGFVTRVPGEAVCRHPGVHMGGSDSGLLSTCGGRGRGRGAAPLPGGHSHRCCFPSRNQAQRGQGPAQGARARPSDPRTRSRRQRPGRRARLSPHTSLSVQAGSGPGHQTLTDSAHLVSRPQRGSAPANFTVHPSRSPWPPADSRG